MRVSKAANHEPNLLAATPPHSTRGSDGDRFGEDLYLFLVSVSQSQIEKELKKKVLSSYLKENQMQTHEKKAARHILHLYA